MRRNRRGDYLVQFCREAKILREAEETGEHYLLAGGGHTGALFEFSQALGDWRLGMKLSGIALEELERLGVADKIDIIATPAIGAIPFAVHLQHAFERHHLKIPNMIYGEKSDAGMVISRFSIPPESRILFVDDVFTTGGTLYKLALQSQFVS